MVVEAVYVTTFVVDLGDMVVGDASYLDLKRQTHKHQGRGWGGPWYICCETMFMGGSPCIPGYTI